MNISDILAQLLPASHPPYLGTAQTYVTYQIMGQDGMLYAEGKEQETGMRYSVDLYTKDDTTLFSMIQSVKAALEDADWIVTIDQEIYEDDTKLWHIPMTATQEGANYG
jgi:hypothetical protein